MLAVSGELSQRPAGQVSQAVSAALANSRRVLVDVSGLRVTWPPAVQLFGSILADLGGWPGARLVLFGADAAQVLDKGIRIAGKDLDPLQLNLALGKVGQVDSPRGPWQFNQPRTPQQKWYLRRVQLDGQVLSNVMINELATLG